MDLKMERLRILAAATALQEFTIPELVAYSGAVENTVRSTLRREQDLFEEIEGDGTRPLAGRPLKHYRVTDTEQIRAQIAEVELSVMKPVHEGMARQISDEDRLAAIVVAEDSVLKALGTEDRDEQELLAKMASESLLQATISDKEQIGTDDALDHRATSISELVKIVQAEARGDLLGREYLARGAQAIADLVTVMSLEQISAFKAGLVNAALRNNELPPLGLLIHENEDPARTIPDLVTHLEDWNCYSLPGTSETFWTQRWAEPLLDSGLVIGVVIHDPGRGVDYSYLDESLSHTKRWNVPAVVVSHRDSMEAVTRTSEAGAFFVPMSVGGPVSPRIIGVLRNSFDRGIGLSQSLGDSFELGAFQFHSSPSIETVD